MSFLHRLKQGIVLSRSSLGVALTTVLRVRVESTTIRRVCAFGFLRQECKTMKEPGWENAAAAKQVLYECVCACVRVCGRDGSISQDIGTWLLTHSVRMVASLELRRILCNTWLF
jgi:hypothetical protein